MESRIKLEMIQSGTLLQERYRVVQQVGKGGMGEIYLAMDERFQSRVAIKRAFFDDAEMRKAFRREAKLLNHLRHAALPKVSDHFSEGDEQFLVMEFIEGFDFAELLTRRKVPFPLSDVLRWADELLDALDYLHTQEPPVIHRDIKPPNIKLTPRGKVMLLDFGLAKGTPTPGQTASGTAQSVFGFSLNFAPLEQMQGSGTDPRSDLYSLAATLYSLLTGVRPPDALARASATIRHQPDPLRPAHLVQPQVPKSVSQILQRAMSQNSVLRHASAAELRAELRRAASEANALDIESQANVVNALAQSVASPDMVVSVKSSASLQESPSPVSQERPQSVSPARAARSSLLSSGEAATTVDTRRRPHPSDSFTVVARAVPPQSKVKGKTFGLAVCLLVMCVAVVAYLLTRASGSSLPDAKANNEVQNSMPSSQQTAPAERPMPAADSVTAESSQNAPVSNASAQSAPARTASETPASNPQTTAEASSAFDPLMPYAKEGNATSNNANGVTTSSAGKPVLVIQNPTPAKSPAKNPADENRPAEEPRQEQPAPRPVYANQPPPGPYPPPPGDWRPPPPDGRRPPPPFQPPNR